MLRGAPVPDNSTCHGAATSSISRIVFVGFAALWLGEGLRARYAVSLLLLLAAVAFRP